METKRGRERKRFAALTGAIILFTAFFYQVRAQATPEIRVAAASDLTRAFREIGVLYEKQTGVHISLVFGASGLLARQIENGGPFDVFAAANESYIGELEKRNLIVPDTRQIYARGRLALWTRTGGLPTPHSLEEITARRYAHIAIADPRVAPYGKAAKEALEAAHLWERVKDRIVYGENIQQTLQFVQSGNAEVGLISYALTVGFSGKAVLVPESLYSPLKQALAVLRSSGQTEAARRFARFVTGNQGQAVLKKYGLAPPPSPSRPQGAPPQHK